MTQALILSAWSFANVGMLAWGVAVAIPVVIHLWNRRTQHVVRWAAMDFLLAAIHKNSRRLRLEQWILLAVRASILLLLAFALADPLVSGLSMLQLGPDQTQRQHTILVVDESYSMAAQSSDRRAGNTTVFDLAKSQAADLVRLSRQGDGFTLLTLGNPPRVVVGNIVFETDDMVREISTLTVGQQGADLAATLGEIDRVIDQTARSYPAIKRCQVVFFTDLGRTTWQAAKGAELRRSIAALAGKADLIVREIGEPTDNNVVINRLTTRTPLAPLQRSISFEAEIHNFSLREQRRRVEFSVDGAGVTQQPVTIPAKGSAAASFSHRFDTPGQHVVEARIDRDAVVLDNRRWLSITTPTAIRVLCVEGRPNAGRYVSLALNPNPDEPADFQAQVVSESRLLDVELQDYDCLFLCNLDRLGGNEAQRVIAFLQGGGGLITILGDQVQPHNYNDQLAGESSSRNLLPASLGEIARDGPHRLDALQYQHPLVAAFRGHERAGLLTVPVWRYLKLLPHDGSQTALAFANGDPALVTQTIGQGRSLLLATSVDADSIDHTTDPIVPWSAFVSWPSFPPLVHEMVNYAIGGRETINNIKVGAAWDMAGAGDDDVVLVDPAGERRHLSTLDRAGEQLARLSGVYRMEYPATGRTTRMVAVNLDTQEGDLERVALADLPSQFASDAENSDDAREFGVDPPNSQLFRLVLAAVFMLVLAESAFSWWLGVRSA